MRYYRNHLSTFGLMAAFSCAMGCNTRSSRNPVASVTAADSSSSIQQIIPADTMAKIRAALPRVAYQGLQDVLTSHETLWYDHDVMTSSYQDSLGAQANTTWPDLVAAPESVISGLHDRSRHRWQFPFGTTAGTDNSTNLKTVNFIHLPHVNGNPLSIPIWQVRRNYDRIEWMWVYPNETMFGEVLFVTQGSELLPTEIRIRTRHKDGWAVNVYRPFPRAVAMSAAVKSRRPNWNAAANLKRLVDHLENNNTLTPKTMAAVGGLQNTFQQTGALDTLPEIEDPGLVKELLTSTTFISAYGESWKSNGSQKAFAAASTSNSSIVPNNYEGGMIEVKEDSCMRCHKEAGRLVSDFYDELYLYGELWGKDAIFSFHPFDETRYSELRAGDENRSINPRLKSMGVFETYDAAKHTPPHYPTRPTPP